MQTLTTRIKRSNSNYKPKDNTNYSRDLNNWKIPMHLQTNKMVQIKQMIWYSWTKAATSITWLRSQQNSQRPRPSWIWWCCRNNRKSTWRKIRCRFRRPQAQGKLLLHKLKLNYNNEVNWRHILKCQHLVNFKMFIKFELVRKIYMRNFLFIFFI